MHPNGKKHLPMAATCGNNEGFCSINGLEIQILYQILGLLSFPKASSLRSVISNRTWLMFACERCDARWMGRIFLSINKWWNSGFSKGTAQLKEIVLVHHPFNKKHKKHILISRVVLWGERNAHLHNPWSYDTLDNRIGGTTLELGNCHTRNWWSLPAPPTNPASHRAAVPAGNIFTKTTVFFFFGATSGN